MEQRQTEDGMPEKVFDVVYATPSFLEKDRVEALGEKLVADPTKGVSRFRVATNYDEVADFLEKSGDTPVLISGLDIPGHDDVMTEAWPLLVASMSRGGYSVVSEGIPQPDRNGFADHHVLKGFHGIRNPEAFYSVYLAPLRDKGKDSKAQTEAAG